MSMQRLTIAVFVASVLLTGTVAYGQIHCAVQIPNSEPSSVRFEIAGALIKHFEAQTVISSNDPDLRPGSAAWTCHRGLDDFDQVSEGRFLVLKHRDLKPPKEEPRWMQSCISGH